MRIENGEIISNAKSGAVKPPRAPGTMGRPRKNFDYSEKQAGQAGRPRENDEASNIVVNVLVTKSQKRRLLKSARLKTKNNSQGEVVRMALEMFFEANDIK